MTDGQDEVVDEQQLLVIDQARHEHALVLSVTGELDMRTGPRLRAALATALGAPGCDPVIVDLTGVTFMGSTGIAVLVDANWEATQNAKDLRVVVISGGAVSRALQATGVDTLLAEYPDLESALPAGHR